MKWPPPSFDSFVRDVQFDVWAAGCDANKTNRRFLYECYREGLSVQLAAKIEVSIQRREAERMRG